LFATLYLQNAAFIRRTNLIGYKVNTGVSQSNDRLNNTFVPLRNDLKLKKINDSN